MTLLVQMIVVLVACSTNRCVVNALEPAVTVQPKNLTVCWIWEDDSFYGTYLRIAAAVDLAVSHVNNFILPDDLRVRVEYQSSGNSCTKTMYSVIGKVDSLLHEKNVKCNVFIGAGCAHTAAALYGYVDKLNVPLMGCPAVAWWTLQAEAVYSDYSLGVVSTFGYSDTADFLVRFFRRHGYLHLSLIRDDSYTPLLMMAEAVTRFFRQNYLDIFSNSSTFPVRSTVADNTVYKQILRTGHERSRVFLLFLHGNGVRDLMIAASQLGYTDGSHVFIAFELFENANWGKVQPIVNDEFDQVLVDAYQSLLLVSFDDQLDENGRRLEEEIKLLARRRYNYTYSPLERVDPVVLGHYEAIVIYSRVVTGLFQEGLDYSNGRSLVRRMANASFDGFRRPAIHISRDRQRDKDYKIQYFSNSTKQFETFYQYSRHSYGNDTFRRVSAIRWPGPTGQLPADVPICGFRGDECEDQGIPISVIAAAIAAPSIFVLLLSGFGGYVMLKIKKMKLNFNPNWWRISLDELVVDTVVINSESKATRSAASQLTIGSRGEKVTRSSRQSQMGEVGARYRGEYVDLQTVSQFMLPASKELAGELNIIRPLEHDNIQRLIGIALSSNNVCQYIIGEKCPKGSLSDVLENETLKLDWSFKNSLIRDVIHGMTYLHSTPVGSHGNLSARTCLVDSRFTLKISDYGLPFFRQSKFLEAWNPRETERDLSDLLWRAPELLRQTMPPKGTPKGDVYSFAIVLQQIILRSGPFVLPGEPLELSEGEILEEIVSYSIPPVRPRVPRSSCSNELYDLMERCWEEAPIERPTFQKIKDRLRKIIGHVGDNIVDLLLKRMEQYAGELEQKVAEQTQQFMDEKNRSEQLLSQLLPRSVAAALTRGEHVEPEAFECVSVFFSDIVGFTTISAKGSPMDVVELLNSLYSFFDSVLEQYDVYKVETIGDAYMVASGLPVRNGNKHASEVAQMALHLQRDIASFIFPRRPEEIIQIRAGINSGTCVAGVVGLKMPKYCLFGDTVNTASRMESSGSPGRIQISAATRNLLVDIGGFVVSERGSIEIKGKGTMVTYWLVNREASAKGDPRER